MIGYDRLTVWYGIWNTGNCVGGDILIRLKLIVKKMKIYKKFQTCSNSGSWTGRYWRDGRAGGGCRGCGAGGGRSVRGEGTGRTGMTAPWFWFWAIEKSPLELVTGSTGSAVTTGSPAESLSDWTKHLKYLLEKQSKIRSRTASHATISRKTNKLNLIVKSS